MKRELLFATVFAAALSMGASAQSGTGQAGQAGQGGTMAQGVLGAEKQAKDQTVTVTGCVANGKEAAPGTAGTSGSSGGDQFVLTNVSGAPASLNATDRVTLSGKDGDLKKHVGHKVEITGKWQNAGMPGSSSDTSSSSATGTSGSSGSLKVSSIKMLAESCSAQ
jgi:hypothetical protein